MNRKVFILCFVQLFLSCSSVTFDDCATSCSSSSNEKSSVPCERGCRFYGIIALTNETTEPLAKCHGDCKTAYKALEEEDLCRDGCQNFLDLAAKEEPKVVHADEEGGMFSNMVPIMQLRQVVTKTVDGIRMIQTRVVAFFRKDDRIIEVHSPTQLIIGVEKQPEPRLPETGLIDSRARESWELEEQERRIDNGGLEMGPSVRPVRARQHAQLMHGMLLLSCTMVVLAVLCYSCLVYRGRRTALRHKQENLAVAVKSEPLKLVRPEDLTKLSLVDEEEHDKQNWHEFALPGARV